MFLWIWSKNESTITVNKQALFVTETETKSRFLTGNSLVEYLLSSVDIITFQNVLSEIILVTNGRKPLWCLTTYVYNVSIYRNKVKQIKTKKEN
jgi:hypothetical protein